ncbi:leucine-rich repeat receptor-like protein kinase family protein [Striga asiatica]|uniref:Leucine-rich repeat receptor-like protein kinase family protein n=1 Tax=Striga asiatica TaxID=4170 RepID=A0A5A7PM63_STRAF|nr:leucine-rich repeat receptor-like protein kinase family protein [Striga asiatica]
MTGILINGIHFLSGIQTGTGKKAPIRNSQTKFRYIPPGPNSLSGPIRPQMTEASKVTRNLGQVHGLSGCNASTSHMLSMLPNIHHATPRLTVPETNIDKKCKILTWAMNMLRGGIFIKRVNGTYPTVNFEKQICNGFSWKDISNNELCNYVVSRLLHNKQQICQKFTLEVLQSKPKQMQRAFPTMEAARPLSTQTTSSETKLCCLTVKRETTIEALVCSFASALHFNVANLPLNNATCVSVAVNLANPDPIESANNGLRNVEIIMWGQDLSSIIFVST